MLKKIYVCSLIFWCGFMPAADERPRTPENQPVRQGLVPTRPARPRRYLNLREDYQPRILFPGLTNDENAIAPSNNHRRCR